MLISVNYQMSTYLFDSEITQFNNHESTTSFTVSNDFSLVVERALHWSKLTDGAFDITIVHYYICGVLARVKRVN
ncbi:MAG: hypothetical protein CM1200mP10_11700 [Candidatus Neomarinimicrobiota bacterium]|nr:MAG: hypothetical protein CM1200mP10_11700 [Candidatus Neomarinimicrobiota bacterium]